MDITLATVVGLGFLVFGLVSARLRHSAVTPPMVFVAFGLAVGDAGLRLVSVRPENASIDLVAELALVVVLFTDASRIDVKLLYREHNLAFRLLTIALPISIVMGAAGAWLFFDGLGFWQLAMLATIFAPTDAALAHGVVSNEKIPLQVRQTISIESGLNDGLCLPLFLMFLCGARLTEHPDTTGYWVRFAAMQISLGPLAGTAIGYVGGNLILRAWRHRWITQSFLRLSTLALALVAYGGAELVGGNGFIAAFCAGLTVGYVSRALCRAIHEFAEAEGYLLTLLVFFVLGAVLIPRTFDDISIAGVFFATFALSVIRILSVSVALIGTGLRRATRWLIGWFGPRGVASIVFALILLEENAVPARREIFAVAIIVVIFSIFAHGLTANPIANLYARHLAEFGHAQGAQLRKDQ